MPAKIVSATNPDSGSARGHYGPCARSITRYVRYLVWERRSVVAVALLHLCDDGESGMVVDTKTPSHFSKTDIVEQRVQTRVLRVEWPTATPKW